MKTPAEQQPNRAAELGAQQAAYEALNAAQLRHVSLAQRDHIWVATEQCGLGGVLTDQLSAPAGARAISEAAERNDMLRAQGIPIPWDHVTELEVTHFWKAECGLKAGSPYLKQLLKVAASKRSGEYPLLTGFRVRSSFPSLITAHTRIDNTDSCLRKTCGLMLLPDE